MASASAPQPRPAANSRPPGVPPASAAPTKPSRLAAIKRGQLKSAHRYLFYGVEGVGKSSLAADAPSPIFFDIEGGADELDVFRYPFRPNEPDGHVPRSWQEVLDAVDDLLANPGHGYATLVVDTIDALEALCHKHICERDGKSSVEEYGYGKGFNIALDEFRVLIERLDRLKARGMDVVLVGHSFVKTFKNPEGEDFDRYQLRVHDKIAGLAKERCDVVGFVRFDGGAAKLKGDAAQTKRARGWATGRRLVQLAREAAWDAKSRLALPSEIELDAAHPWSAFAGAPVTEVDELRAQVTTEIDRICAVAIGGEEFMTAAGRLTSRSEVLDIIAKSDATVITRVLAGLRATTTTVTKET